MDKLLTADFDTMVEALEEAEDMVECKECFELFPKTNCVKTKIGYICPTCKDYFTGLPDCASVEPAVNAISQSEIDELSKTPFELSFPDVTFECDSEDECSVEPFDTSADFSGVIVDLVNDEIEAIDGYESAKATVATLADVENKEEIEQVFDHITEEEKEHIEELTDLLSSDADDESTEVVAAEPVEAEESEIEETEIEDEVEETKELLTEASADELKEIAELSKEIGIDTTGDLETFLDYAREEEGLSGTTLEILRAYRDSLGPDFKLTESMRRLLEYNIFDFAGNDRDKQLQSFFKGGFTVTVRNAENKEIERSHFDKYRYAVNWAKQISKAKVQDKAKAHIFGIPQNGSTKDARLLASFENGKIIGEDKSFGVAKEIKAKNKADELAGNRSTAEVKLNAPVVTLEKDTATWSPIENATAYEYQIDDGEWKETVEVAKVQLKPNQKIKVKAKAALNGKVFYSDPSKEVTYVADESEATADTASEETADAGVVTAEEVPVEGSPVEETPAETTAETPAEEAPAEETPAATPARATSASKVTKDHLEVFIRMFPDLNVEFFYKTKSGEESLPKTENELRAFFSKPIFAKDLKQLGKIKLKSDPKVSLYTWLLKKNGLKESLEDTVDQDLEDVREPEVVEVEAVLDTPVDANRMRKHEAGIKEDFDEDIAVCTCCGGSFPVSELYNEFDMGDLCDKCARELESRGETLAFIGRHFR